MKQKRGFFSRLVTIVCILVIIVSLYEIFITLYPRYQEEKRAEEVQNTAITDNTINWDALLAINPDTVGWLTIPGTHIDYPIVQTTDNDYYLLHNFDKEEYGYGNPFLDYTYDMTKTPSPQNAVIYGHASRWGDQVAFEGLEKYSDYNYYLEHPTLYFTKTTDGNIPVEYEIVAVIKEGSTFDYRQTDFSSPEEFINYYNNVLSRKIYDTGKVINSNDQLVTLSSCIYDINDGRIGVIARRIT